MRQASSHSVEGDKKTKVFTKDKRYREAREIDKGRERNPWTDEKNEIAQEKREQERETVDKNTLCYCIPNLQKLVHQVPLCGKVLASL